MAAAFLLLLLVVEIQMRLVEEPYERATYTHAYDGYAPNDRPNLLEAWSAVHRS